MSKPINPKHPLRQGDGAPVEKSAFEAIAKPFRYLKWYLFERARGNAERELPVARGFYGNEEEAPTYKPGPSKEVVWELGKPETWLHGVHPEDIKLRNLDGAASQNVSVGVGKDPETGEPVTLIQFRADESCIKMPPPEAFGLTQQQVQDARDGLYDGVRRGRDSNGFLRNEAKAVPISMAVSAVKRSNAQTPQEAGALIKVLEAITGKSAEEVIAEQRLAEAKARVQTIEDSGDIAVSAITEALQALNDNREDFEEQDVSTAEIPDHDPAGGEG